MPSDPQNKKVLVTGASTGIGRAVVLALAGRGYLVHAIARSRDRLAQLADECGCAFDDADIRDAVRMRQIVDTVKPEILVNNAGTSAAFRLLPATAETIAETMETNLTATLCITRFALDHMVAAGNGHVVMMGSIAGMHPTASTVYAATKGGLRRVSQALRLELMGLGIRVSEVCPGIVDTGLLPEELRKLTNGAKLLTPADVADAVRYTIEAPAHVNISTIELLPVEQSVGGVQVTPRRRR